MTEFYVPLAPGLEGRVLKPHHPDPRFPMLGVELDESFADREFNLREVCAWTDRFGAVAFKKIGEGQVPSSPDVWGPVPVRTNYTRIPHIDHGIITTRLVHIALMKRFGQSVSAATCVSGLDPVVKSFLDHLDLVCPRDPVLKRQLSTALESGNIYTRDGLVQEEVINALSLIRDCASTGHPDRLTFVQNVQSDLAADSLALSWSDYEMVSVAAHVAHWGDMGIILPNDLVVLDLSVVTEE